MLPPGETGEVVIRGAERHARLREQSRGQRRRLHQRLVPHRRPGHARRGRLPHAHRPAEGDHQPRRREDLPARGRRGAAGPPGGGAGGDLRDAARQARRGGRGGGGAARRGEARPSASCATSPPRRLADFKVPRKVLFLDEIPKGATGKLQRIGLARELGLHRQHVRAGDVLDVDEIVDLRPVAENHRPLRRRRCGRAPS